MVIKRDEILELIFLNYYFTVSKGDRIAQLILERIFIPDLEELPVSKQHFKKNVQTLFMIPQNDFLIVH